VIEDRPELVAAIRPLLGARKAIERQVGDLDRKVHRLARHDVQVRRFMTVPGVGPITALCFKATINDPTRFKRSRGVGAYIGLTTRRHASGEIDWSGRISKCGDAMLRMYLFEAAGVLLNRVPEGRAAITARCCGGAGAARPPQRAGPAVLGGVGAIDADAPMSYPLPDQQMVESPSIGYLRPAASLGA
jgi:transposase